MPFDLIVVGGGHNGLVCATYAARTGLSVAVIERQTEVGGAAVTEEFHPGFRNSAASYTVSLLEPRIIEDLALGRRGLTIVPRPMENFVPALAGLGLELPGSGVERRAAIARHSASDADAYERYGRELDAIVRLVKPFWLEAPVDLGAGLPECWRGLQVAARSFAAGPRVLARTFRLLRASAGRWLDAQFSTDLLKGALGFDSIVGHFASPYASDSGYLLLHHALGELEGRRGAWGHAVGGMGAISSALAAAAKAHGVEIMTGESVERIGAENGGFVVATSAGQHAARRVAGAIHPQRLFLDLLAGASLPPDFKQRIETWRSESASFRINVALSELPDFTCRPGIEPARHHGAGILIAPSLGYLDAAYQTALDTGFSDAPVIELVIPSVLDTTLAPAGRHVASLFCQHFRYRQPGGASWDALRDTAVDRILDTVTAYAPNFRRAVIALKASTPLDLERRFGLIGGDIFHGAMSLEQLYHRRPARGYARYRTPVPGLYLCASGAHPGGGVSGAPGFNAAAAIVADAARD
jgi:phytoene dehydrogenase-like protein